MSIDLYTFAFTVVIIVAGVLYGQYTYYKGVKDGEKNLVNNLYNAGIIEIDEDGDIISP